MQLVNGLQFLFFFLLFVAAPTAAVFGTVIVALTNIYASLQSHERDLNIEVLNLI